MKNRYFLVGDGPVMAAILSEHEEIKRINKVRYDFITEVGAKDDYHVSGPHVLALCFDEDPGKLWKRAPRLSSKAYTPRRVTKEGRALSARMGGMSYPSHRPVFEAAGLRRHQDAIEGGRLRQASFGTIGDNMVIVAPFTERSEPYTPAPEMCIKEIRESEYYRMREDAEEG
jgi:hypothetical protein